MTLPLNPSWDFRRHLIQSVTGGFDFNPMNPLYRLNSDQKAMLLFAKDAGQEGPVLAFAKNKPEPEAPVKSPPAKAKKPLESEPPFDITALDVAKMEEQAKGNKKVKALLKKIKEKQERHATASQQPKQPAKVVTPLPAESSSKSKKQPQSFKEKVYDAANEFTPAQKAIIGSSIGSSAADSLTKNIDSYLANGTTQKASEIAAEVVVDSAQGASIGLGMNTLCDGAKEAVRHFKPEWVASIENIPGLGQLGLDKIGHIYNLQQVMRAQPTWDKSFKEAGKQTLATGVEMGFTYAGTALGTVVNPAVGPFVGAAAGAATGKVVVWGSAKTYNYFYPPLPKTEVVAPKLTPSTKV